MAEGDDGKAWGDAAACIALELRAVREAFNAAWAVIWGPMPITPRSPFACVLFEDRDARARGSALGMAVPIMSNPWAESLVAAGGAITDDAPNDPRLAVPSDVIRRNGIVAMASAAYQREGAIWGVCEVYSPAALRLPPDPLGVLRGVAQRVAALVEAAPRRELEPSEAPATDPMTAAALHDLKSALAAQTLLIASFDKEIRAAAARPPTDQSPLAPLLESLAVLRESVSHANELARVMTLGTMAPGTRAQIDLRGVLRLALAAVAPDLRERFTVEVDDMLAELGPVPDAPGVLRAVHNLVQNAALAVQRDERGRAWVRVRAAVSDVLIEVEDEGPGVPAAVLDRLFQPGVTTREHPQGHGYGLYSARKTVEGLGGTLTLFSVPGKGALYDTPPRARRGLVVSHPARAPAQARCTMDPSAPSPEQAYQDEIRFRAKRELRKRMRALRAAMPASAVRERSDAVARRVLEHPAWLAARTVGLFMSMPDEVQTDTLIAAARAAGKSVALPVVTDAPALTFRAPWAEGVDRGLVLSAFGIMEPGEDAPLVAPEALDFVLVPALAADERGHRIGYGRGYYDRTFTGVERPVRVCVAFDFQLIVEVPERAGDLRTHWVITDRRTLQAAE